MDIGKLLQKNVEKAFKIGKSLLVDITFVSKTATDFNFATSSATVTTDSTKVIKGFQSRSFKKGSQEPLGMTYKSLIVKTADVGDVSAYDTVSIAGGVWGIADVPSSNPATTEILVVRRA